MSKQTKLEAGIEATLNTISGFVISYSVWVFIVAPLYPWLTEHTHGSVSAFIITSVFTVTSLIRSYVWRRFFANDLHKRVHAWVMKRNKSNGFKVGDNVISEHFGKGVVVDINDTRYPIHVRFKSNLRTQTYTHDGLYTIHPDSHLNISKE